MQTTIIVMLLAGSVTALNLLVALNKTEQDQLYTCKSGQFSGQTHNINDWRKIALELAKTVKNSTLNARLKYGTDEDLLGLLYTNFGVELWDV